MLNRLSSGPNAAGLKAIAQQGSRAWIAAQLQPERIATPPELSHQLAALGSLNQSPLELAKLYRQVNEAAKTDNEAGKALRRAELERVAVEGAQARVWRALRSDQQLKEQMVDFWFNHFNVFRGKGLCRVLVGHYEEHAIRPHAMGRFRDILGATFAHPAMLFYLDQWQSAKPGFVGLNRAKNQASGLNENYARELMELHTLGVDGGYMQRDVTELARMLTGWTLDLRPQANTPGLTVFDPKRHDDGSKQWLGKTVVGAGADEAKQALDLLARHPSTARHIAYKLVQYFVSDQPSPNLVRQLAERFITTDGDIRAVLAVLLESTEFLSASQVQSKFKTPLRYVISCLRACDSRADNIRPVLAALQQLGMPLHGCQTPDGYKNTEAAWLNPDAMERRISFATALGTGRLRIDEQGLTPDGVAIRALLDPLISDHTRKVLAQNPPKLGAALLLGSPEFMRH